MNICILGDSISKGVTFDGLSSKYNQLKNSYVAILQEKFGLSINNLSKFGCTVTKGLAMLDFHKQAVAESQYAIVEYGGNDSDMRWDEVAKAPDCTHLPLTEKSDFRCKYEDMIRQIQNLGTTPILLNLPPIDAQRYFERISQGKNGENI
ncbi:MAG: SGNH/GDSL hydrolase family protein, partial [Spirochaetales bacterium]|nr:SGNH/GDSL hydrolase family protein [Spirochaetales bacterium]